MQMIWLNYVRTCIVVFKLTKSQKKINNGEDDLNMFNQKQNITSDSDSNYWIYSRDIGMKFGIEKCDLFIMKKGEIKTKEIIKLVNQERIRTERKKEDNK